MTMTPRTVAVLGSTGSIGQNCLDVIRAHPGRFRIVLLTAHRNHELLASQAVEFSPEAVVLTGGDRARCADEFAGHTEFRTDPEDICGLIRRLQPDIVVSAIVGAAGLLPTWTAVDTGCRVALANKESLVVAGDLMTRRAAESGAVLLPVDSEHSAVFQSLTAGRSADVRRIILTASGGPFRGKTAAELKDVTPEAALKHPTWEMGRKITIDSATMMNKALEIIEARWLFSLTADQISVVVHPQSLIHSFVEFLDGSVVSQMSPPDMRLPIQYALTYPERLTCPGPEMDWTQACTLGWEPPDFDAFPALKLGFRVAGDGGTAGAVLNAANEIAVERFLDGEIRFDQISLLCEAILDNHTFDASPSLDELLRTDERARKEARQWTSHN